jgi:hypothetical protein
MSAVPVRRYWQVKATSATGSVMTFGLEAVDREDAVVQAIDRIPFPASSENIQVTEIPPRRERPKPVTQMRRVPVNMTQDELATVLEDIVTRVQTGDSFEGNITYAIPEDGLAAPGSFDVMASYRVGNRQGQGGMRMIGRWVDAREGGGGAQ